MQATRERLRQRRQEEGKEGGFTLIELLIVIVILGILAGIVVFAVSSLTGTSAQASCKSDFKSVETAAEAYKAQNSSYPTSVGALVPTYLKDTPTNAGHYEIQVSGADASGNLVETVTPDPDPAGTTAYGTDISACNSVK